MLSITRSGRIADVIAAVRDVPERIVPYAASTALTRTVQRAQSDIIAQLPNVFASPVPYTLGATRIEPARKDNLVARVSVKNQSGGVKPENYLLPEVEGGSRQEKRFERALRYAGVLQSGERVLPGQEAPLDSAGNLSGATVRAMLREVGALVRKGKTLAPKRRAKGAPQAGPYFIGAIKGQRGLWLREGRSIKPLLIFTSAQPTYRKRLDFTAIAEKAALQHFEPEFRAALDNLLARRR